MVGALAAALSVVGAAQVQAATTIGKTGPKDLCDGSASQVQGANTVPFDGVITSFTLWADAGGSARLIVFVPRSENVFRAVARSELKAMTISGFETFSVRVPVVAGQLVGHSGAVCITPSPGAVVHWADGEVADNVDTTFDFFKDASDNFSAVLEPDADRDGFGDETQDKCPTNASTQGACPLPDVSSVGVAETRPDTTKPSLGSLSLSSAAFKAAPSGAAFSAQKKRAKSKAPTGTRVSFNLSEPSSVKFAVQRKASGRKVGRTCAKPKRSNRKKKKCTRWETVKGSFAVAGKSGRNTFTFRGRLGGKALKPGGYRLTGTATDQAKNASLPRLKAFTIVR